MSAAAGAGGRARRLYVDTSAYLCILLGEAGADHLSAETAEAELLSSVLLVLEARRNLVRLAREATLTLEQYAACMHRIEADVERFVMRDLSLDLCSSTLMPAVATPRSLDLAHLRTAVWFHAADPIDRFVTMDVAQREAASDMGLPV